MLEPMRKVCYQIVMQDFLIKIWADPWWTFQPESASAWSYLYRNFNIVEGFFWIGFATVVLRRYLQHRKSNLEVLYAAVFLIFGLTDFVEAYEMSAPLLLAKAVIVVALFSLRSFVHQKFYPTAWY